MRYFVIFLLGLSACRGQKEPIRLSPLDMKTLQLNQYRLQDIEKAAQPLLEENKAIKAKYCTLAKIPIENCAFNQEGTPVDTKQAKKK